MTERAARSTLSIPTTGTGITNSTSERWEPRAGAVVKGRWRLDRRISAGTSVETWMGADLQLERQIALQVIRQPDLDDREAQRAFERRVTLLARVEHPNVMRIFDVVVAGGDAISVCEWIDGIVLEDALQKGLGGWTAAACVGIQVAAGLDALHGQGLVHRNVFPPNVMVTNHGIAKITGGGRIRNLYSDSTLTDRDLLLIKTGYVAPERMDGSSRDPRVDVYATGVMLWELTTGRRAVEIVTDGSEGLQSLPRASDSAPEIPSGFDDVIVAATHPDPKERPADGGVLYDLLSPLVPQRPAETLGGLLNSIA